MIGDVCPSGGECYGNGAKKCKDENPRYTTKGRSSFMYKAIADRMSLWHTCTQDWKCDFKATKFPIHLQNEGGKIQYYTSDEHGKDIKLTKETLRNGIHQEGKYVIHFHPIEETPSSTAVDVHCFGASRDDILCTLKGHSSVSGKDIVFIVEGPKHIGILRNMEMRIIGSIKIVDETRLKIETINHKHSGNLSTKNQNSASTLSDVVEQIHLVQASQLQSLYNAGAMMGAISDLQRTLSKVITSSSKLDERLIGNIIGVEQQNG